MHYLISRCQCANWHSRGGACRVLKSQAIRHTLEAKDGLAQAHCALTTLLSAGAGTQHQTCHTPAICVCCSSELNWWMVVNMSTNLTRRFANSSLLRKTATSSISNGCSITPFCQHQNSETWHLMPYRAGLSTAAAFLCTLCSRIHIQVSSMISLSAALPTQYSASSPFQAFLPSKHPAPACIAACRSRKA